MTKEEYIYNHSKILLRDKRKANAISFNLVNNHDKLSEKRWSKLNADYSFLLMEIDKTKERIGYVLGYLTLFEMRDEYNPTGWHKYQGVKDEVKSLKFDK